MTRYWLPVVVFSTTLAVALAVIGLMTVAADTAEPATAPDDQGDIPHRGLQTPWWERIQVSDETVAGAPSPGTVPVETSLEEPVPDTTASVDEATTSSAPAPTVLRSYQIPADVYFATDSVELTDAGAVEIGRLAENELADAVSITVGGCTDPRGSDDHNRALGLGRAASTVAVLDVHGVDPAIVATEACDETRLTERRPGQDETEWLAENRRIVIDAVLAEPATTVGPTTRGSG